ncbi:MAG: flagellar assembly peptidoglycan hydrolase FlgJ [Gammaproteobacteria bacterium]
MISQASIYTDFQGLNELKTAGENSPEALRAVAKQFEALFTQMMLKNMRNTSLGDGIFDNDQSKMYQEMFDKQIALSMSESKGLGLADMIYRQLGGQSEEKPVEGVKNTLSANAVKQGHHVSSFSSANEFVKQLLPHAQKAAQEIGVDPEILLSQAALETGWGQTVLSRPDGTSSHNLFNIKADHRWQGDKVSSTTLEFSHGVAEKRQESFRSYHSFEEGFNDYITFLKTGVRYQDVINNSKDSGQYITGLQNAGYATDPDYAKKIIRVMGSETMTTALSNAGYQPSIRGLDNG